MEENTSHTSSRRDIYMVIFSHKKSILTILIATFFLALVGVSVWPETYEARSRLLVKVGRENVTAPAVPPTAQHQVVASMGLRREDINSEIVILSESRILENVVDKLGIDYLAPSPLEPETLLGRVKYTLRSALKTVKDQVYETLYYLDLKKRLSPYEKVVGALRENLSAERVRDSDAIEVRLKWFDPGIAEEALRSILDLYLEQHLEAHRTSGGYEFFEKQVETMEEHLRDSEESLEELKKKLAVNSYAFQRDLLLGQIDRLDALIKTTEAEISGSEEKCDQIEKQLSSLHSSIPPGYDLINAEAEKRLLLEQAQLESLLAKQDTLMKQIGGCQEQADELTDYEFELQRLEREIEIGEINYRLYRTKLEETRISDVLDAEKIANVKVINTPTAAIEPVRPKKLIVIGLSMIVAALVSISCAMISEYFDHSIRTTEDVEKYLDLRTLASIPETRRCTILRNTKN